MVAIKSTVIAAIGFLALGAVAVDDRLLAKIPDEAQTCKIWVDKCDAYVKGLHHKATTKQIDAYCQPGKAIGGTSAEIAVICSYTEGKTTTNYTSKVISRAGLLKA